MLATCPWMGFCGIREMDHAALGCPLVCSGDEFVAFRGDRFGYSIEMAEEIPETSSARQLTAYSFLAVFANDGTIDEAELKHLEKIALKDGIVDEEEKQVLSNLFSRVSKATVTEAVWEEICAFRKLHGID